MRTRGLWGRDGALWRRRRLVLAVWGVAILVTLPFAALQTEHLSGGGWVDQRSQSAEVERAIEQGRYEGVQASVLALVLSPTEATRPGDLARALRDSTPRIDRAGDVRVAPHTLATARRTARSAPGRPLVVPLTFEHDEAEAIDLAKDIRRELGIDGSEPGRAEGGRVEVHLAGQGALWAAYQKVADDSVKTAEARGFPVIALVLLFAFGSFLAAALPLALGAAAVIVTGAVIFALSLQFEMSIFVTSMASMIGIGVAVDYSLFVLVRYREEVRAGRSPDEARVVAMATSGRAVSLAGLTVAISLASLFLFNSPGLRSVAVGAIVVVALSVLGASTLLMALIGLLGPRAYEQGRLGRFLERRRGDSDRTFWTRWTAVVMRRPALTAISAIALLLAVAAPALDLHVRNGAVSQLDSGHEVRRAIADVESVLGPGALGPARVEVTFDEGRVGDPANARALSATRRAIATDPLVEVVSEPLPSRNRRSALLTTLFTVDPESQAARDAVDRLRDRLPDATASRAEIAVGGTTAVSLDFDRLVSSQLWKLLAVVLGLSFVVLLVLLRSLLLPLKAMVMNALSVAAAYGVVVAIFQYGWLSFAGIDKSPSMYPTQPFVIAVAFGLSMDYHVFLLSRIREHYAETRDNRLAVTRALASSGTPITSAALIMVAVFMAFASASAPSVQQLGVAAAVAIAVDATIVRLVIVPAAMEVLGEWNWWLPRPLARLLPGMGGMTIAPAATDRA